MLSNSPPDTSGQYGHGRQSRSRRFSAHGLGPRILREFLPFVCPIYEGSVRTLPGDEAMDPIQVEGPDNLLYRTFRKIEGTHDLVPGTACQEHDNDDTPAIRFLVSCTHGSVQIGEGRVFWIGVEIPLGHDSYISNMSQQMSRNININR